MVSRLDPLSETIFAHPAATVEGLAVKARALTYRSDREIWDAEDSADLDWHDEGLRSFVEAVLRLAGVDRFGRPIAAA